MSDWLVAMPNRRFALLPAAHLLFGLFGFPFLSGALLCNGSPWPLLSLAAGVLWCLVVVSLPLGLVAIGLRQFRLIYLVLLALAPLTLIAQQLLLDQGLMRCNWL